MKPGTLEKAGFAVIGAALAAGLVLDAFLPAAGAAAAALVLVMVVGSSFRTMLAALLLQILVTASQLDAVKAALGIPVLGPDDIPPPPLMNAIARTHGYIPINRGNLDRPALEQALAILEQGGILGIFPEGTSF